MRTIKQGIVHYEHRAAAISLHAGYLLLQGEPRGTLWTLPGGGIEALESSQEALRREMQEELKIDIYIERLLWICEEFFMIEDTPHHQFGFYYLATPVAAPHLYNLDQILTAVDGGCDILFQWFKLDHLHTIQLYPTFLPASLQTLPTTPQHITHIDETAQRWRQTHR